MKYEEHEKLKLIRDQSQLVGNFLEWCEDKGMYLYESKPDCEWPVPVRKRKEELLAEFFEINLRQLENEKLHMLEEIRKHNEGRT